MLAILDETSPDLSAEDVAARARDHGISCPIQTIIPWRRICSRNHHQPGEDGVRKGFLGFWMLGGMSGGGMGFIFDPAKKARARRGCRK